jgi:hypothetical protein
VRDRESTPVQVLRKIDSRAHYCIITSVHQDSHAPAS